MHRPLIDSRLRIIRYFQKIIQGDFLQNLTLVVSLYLGFLKHILEFTKINLLSYIKCIGLTDRLKERKISTQQNFAKRDC